MKYVLLSIVGFYINLNVTAQIKIVDDGILTYSVSTTLKAKDGTITSLPSTYRIYKNGSKIRTEYKNNFGFETEVFNFKTDTGFILKEYSNQKIMIPLNKLQWLEKYRWQSNIFFSLKHDTATINGYPCNLATATFEDGNKVEVYYCPTITLPHVASKLGNKQIDGLVIQYTIYSTRGNETYLLSSLQNIKPSLQLFDAPKSSYRVLNYTTLFSKNELLK